MAGMEISSLSFLGVAGTVAVDAVDAVAVTGMATDTVDATPPETLAGTGGVETPVMTPGQRALFAGRPKIAIAMGQAIKAARLQKGFSCRELSEKTGIPQGTLYSTEDGRLSLSRERVGAVEGALGLTPGSIEMHRPVGSILRFDVPSVSGRILAQALVDDLKASGLSVTIVARAYDGKNGTVHSYFRGTALPPDDFLTFFARLVRQDVGGYLELKGKVPPSHQKSPVGKYWECFGRVVQERRKQQGLSGEDVARLCDVTPDAIRKIEKGFSLMSTGLAEKLDHALGWPRFQTEMLVCLAKANVDFHVYLKSVLFAEVERMEKTAQKPLLHAREVAHEIEADDRKMNFSEAEKAARGGFDEAFILEQTEIPELSAGMMHFIPMETKKLFGAELIRAAHAVGIDDSAELSRRLDLDHSLTRSWWHKSAIISNKYHDKVERAMGWQRGSMMAKYRAAWIDEMKRRIAKAKAAASTGR